MSDFRSNPDIAEAFKALEQRIANLEAARVRRFGTDRPPASQMPGAIIFNTTTSKHELSNGSTWDTLTVTIGSPVAIVENSTNIPAGADGRLLYLWGPQELYISQGGGWRPVYGAFHTH